jgi:hypothetical protein
MITLSVWPKMKSGKEVLLFLSMDVFFFIHHSLHKMNSTYSQLPPKNSENLSALRVAEVTMTLRSLLLAATFFKMPKSTSVCRDLRGTCHAVQYGHV